MSNKRKRELRNEFNELVILHDFAKVQLRKEENGPRRDEVQARLARIERELARVGALLE